MIDYQVVTDSLSFQVIFIAILVLVDVNDMGVAVRKQTSLAPLTTDTRLLVTTKDGLRRRLLPRVDKDGTSFESSRNLGCLLDVLAPYTRTETGVCVVGAGNDFLEVRPRLSGHDGTEGLFLDDAGVVGRVVDDGGLNEETL